MDQKKVAIIMGSDSDYPVVKNAELVLKDLGIPYVTRIMSAHRTPEQVIAFATSARDEGFSAIIAAAGKAAHLAGVIAAHTNLPVIGVPIKSSAFGGLDALLSTVQMPRGVPVATVAVDRADNAALLAAQILAVHDADIEKKLLELRARMKEEVMAKDEQFRANED
ncbi:MAG: 5-(carboxyamino)imidazole ribonucleotide mutase [Bacillota bacterium]|jgi:5-(carboxyamino)imidazole ribonucleotide mutase|nr:5-(carboxyamino)imidazole ribonucleotide mutase [Bacillota bacterium]NLM07327.1 5-(carboxyamino)imidazole ribonucleotide mutase [Clostridiales Family XIII bacterium]